MSEEEETGPAAVKIVRIPDRGPVEHKTRHILGSEEKTDLGEELARSHQQLAELERERAEFMRDHKSRVERLQNRIVDCSLKITNGYEERDVLAPQYADYFRRRILFLHPDTHIVLAWRKMTEEEATQPVLVGDELNLMPEALPTGY